VTSGQVAKSEESFMSASHHPSTLDPPVPLPAKPPPFFISSRVAESGGSIRLVLAGELDLAARSNFETVLDQAQHDSDRVLLDLRALSLIDCSCLATVFVAASRARGKGAALALLDPRDQVRRVLDLVGPPPEVAVLSSPPEGAVA
jgi:anti-anti-sigma factor